MFFFVGHELVESSRLKVQSIVLKRNEQAKDCKVLDRKRKSTIDNMFSRLSAKKGKK